MRKLLVPVLLLLSLSSFSQEKRSFYKPVYSKAYAGKYRLDSVLVPYAQAVFRQDNAYSQAFTIVFSPGERTVEDSTGRTFSFFTVADALNFLDFQGWEYVDQVLLKEQQVFLLRRKAAAVPVREQGQQ